MEQKSNSLFASVLAIVFTATAAFAGGAGDAGAVAYKCTDDGTASGSVVASVWVDEAGDYSLQVGNGSLSKLELNDGDDFDGVYTDSASGGSSELYRKFRSSAAHLVLRAGTLAERAYLCQTTPYFLGR